jgi:hypothetical protein
MSARVSGNGNTVVQNRRLLRFARNDNVNKIQTLVSLRGAIATRQSRF